MQEGTTSTKHRECVSNTTAHNPTLLNTHAHIQQEMKKRTRCGKLCVQNQLRVERDRGNTHSYPSDNLCVCKYVVIVSEMVRKKCKCNIKG